MRKSDQVKKYEFWGLMLFVGIPLPGTGAWTGSLIASLLEIDIRSPLLQFFVALLWQLSLCLRISDEYWYKIINVPDFPLIHRKQYT